MRIKNYKKIEVVGAHEEVLALNGADLGDVVASEVYVELKGDCELAALGTLEGHGSELAPVKLINMGTLEVVDKATVAGIYMIMSGCLSKLTLRFNGNVEAIIKELF